VPPSTVELLLATLKPGDEVLEEEDTDGVSVDGDETVVEDDPLPEGSEVDMVLKAGAKPKLPITTLPLEVTIWVLVLLLLALLVTLPK